MSAALLAGLADIDRRRRARCRRLWVESVMTPALRVLLPRLRH